MSKPSRERKLTKKTPNGLLTSTNSTLSDARSFPPKEFRQLREIARYRFKPVCMKSSEKNRIQNCMTVPNVGIAGVLSDPFDKTATEIMSYLLTHTSDSIDERAVHKLIKKGQKLNPMKSLRQSRGTT